MKNYDVKYEVLEGLREITKLNPIAEFKILRARRQADKFIDIYRKLNPGDEMSVDYSVANDLEYELRMEALSRSLEKGWAQYIALENDGLGLEDYVSDYLVNYMNNRNKTMRR